jgi:acyl-CoA thioesterase-1
MLPKSRHSFRYGLSDRVFNGSGRFGRRLAPLLALFLLLPGAITRADETVILAFGDSLTAGYGLAATEAFPARLEKKLRAEGHDVRVINGGLSGDTTTGGLSRLDWALADRPDLVIVELGANDALRGIAPEVTRANLDAILDKLNAAGVDVLLAGMRAPPNLGDEYAAAFDGIFAELAEDHDVTLYPFFLAGVAAVPALNQSDGMHPNADGIDTIVRNIAPAVKRLISGPKD